MVVTTIMAIEASPQIFPRVEPFPSGIMQSVSIAGIPLIFPPEFPVEAGLPTIVPYAISVTPGEYEFSLDYGMDCEGAGACRYGVIPGCKKILLFLLETATSATRPIAPNR